MELLLLAAALVGASGLPGLFFPRGQAAGQWLATLLAVGGCSLGLVATAMGLVHPTANLTLPLWNYLPGARFNVGIDVISAVFLAPIWLVCLLGSVYGMAYWKESEHPRDGRKLRFFYGLLAAALALVVIARDSMVFLFGWELMALSAFFLVTTDDQDAEVRSAGWLYLAATHTATLLLFAMFALLREAAGTNTFELPYSGMLLDCDPALANAIFLLALLGFGLKGGLAPMHIWLPSSHAMAPSHVSAMMSGVIIKMGIYGLFRVTSMFPVPPVWWGALLVALGAISGVFGIAFAIAQQDVKRLLAYSSVENIGVIVMALGLALLGKSRANVDWIMLGMAGATMHVWSHAAFKSMLFLCAGSIIHATKTRRLDWLGGLAKRTPLTALCFGLGCVAACALPPFGAFTSEWLIYLGLYETMGFVSPAGPAEAGAGIPAVVFAAPALALIGAMAVACFVSAFGVIFLGSARTENAAAAHESSPWMTRPMLILMGLGLLLGLFPNFVSPLLEGVAMEWAGEPRGPMMRLPNPDRVFAKLAPLNSIMGVGLAIVATFTVLFAVLRWRLRGRTAPDTVTWGCGYAAPTPRMQYTSSSFGQMLTLLFSAVLRPIRRRPKLDALFPTRVETAATRYSSRTPDSVLDRLIWPLAHRVADAFGWFRRFQRGNVQAYLIYIFVALAALLLWR